MVAQRRLILALIMAAGLAGGSVLAVNPNPPTNSLDSPVAAISPHVLSATENGASASFLVVLREQADLKQTASLYARAEKGRAVYESLRQVALRTQPPLWAELDRAGASYRSFYVVNMTQVMGNRSLVLQLAARPDVARIEANPDILSQFPILASPSAVENQSSVEWNIQKVGAPAAWAMGYTGQGVVVAGADTGYQWDHPALRTHYRGWDGLAGAHDYNWHDAIHDSAGNPCGNDSPVPCDDSGHGTHTMGTMVGDDGSAGYGGGNQVGMAPDAQWIGCRNMASGWGTPARYIECFEFFLAPYPVGGNALTQGVPSLAPAVIGNSWSCPGYEGCPALTLQTAVNNVRAAGIEVVGAAQNYGPSCSTVSEPIGIYTSTFTVGATDWNDSAADFSSRGPVISDGSGRRKPDISAPGVSVRSSVPGGGYSYMQGTSMATPHVAGLFALVWSAAPGLMDDLAASEAVITRTAVRLTTTQGCGGDTSTDVPNNVYGWGRIDAQAAVQAALPSLRIVKSASANLILPNSLLTYTLVVSNPSLYAVNTNLVVADVLPQAAAFVSASGGGVYSPTTGMVTWLAPTLTAQTGFTFTMGVTVGTVPSGTLIVNTEYRARSDQITPAVSGPPVTTTVSLTLDAELQVSKTAIVGPVLPGSLLTYTLVVANPSQAVDGTGIVVTDTLPPSVTFAGASPGGVYSDAARWVTWRVPVLASRSSLTFTLGVSVGQVLTGTRIVNSDYGARSDQITQTVTGPPVITVVRDWPYRYYLPIYLASP